MIITVASFKGGVGKTTTAVHLAAFLEQRGKSLLIDGDPNRSTLSWSKRGSLPFKVVDERQAAMHARDYEYVVIDTQARPEKDDLEALAQGCHMLVLPTTPDVLSLDALNLTIASLKSLGSFNNYKVLLTVVPPRPSRDGDEARLFLEQAGLPVFKRPIRRYSVFQKAALAGLPVNQVNDPKSIDAWNDYQSVGEEILNGQEQIRSGIREQSIATVA